MTKLSENIKTFRTMRKMTQTDLAVLLHRSVGAVSNWEKGSNLPDADTIEEICKILEVTPNELFGWNENKEHLEYMVELDDAISYIEQVKADRAAQDQRLKAYAEKFGKLLNSKDK